MSLHGYSGAYGDYVQAVEDFLGILEHYAGAPDVLEQHVIDAADNLFEAAYDANLGVWPSDA